MNTHTHTKAVLAGLSALSLLAITACSSASDASVDTDSADTSAAKEQTAAGTGEATYNFSPEADLSSSGELRVEIPEGLAEASEKYAQGRLFDHIVVRAGDHPESSCSIEIDYGYVDEERDIIENHTWADWYPADSGEEPTWHTSSTDEVYEGLLGFGDETEISDDRTSSITPLSCAKSPTDDSDTLTLAFKRVSKTELRTDEEPPADRPRNTAPATTENRTLATVDINIVASGDVHVVTSEVESYHYSGDEHGWLHNSQTVDSQGNVIDS